MLQPLPHSCRAQSPSTELSIPLQHSQLSPALLPCSISVLCSQCQTALQPHRVPVQPLQLTGCKLAISDANGSDGNTDLGNFVFSRATSQPRTSPQTSLAHLGYSSIKRGWGGTWKKSNCVHVELMFPAVLLCSVPFSARMNREPKQNVFTVLVSFGFFFPAA